MITIGLDWGKTNIRIAAVNDVGKIVAFKKNNSKPLPNTWELLLESIEKMISEFLSLEELKKEKVSQISVGVAGVGTHYRPRADVKIHDVFTVLDNDVMMIARTIPLKDAILCYAGTGSITIFPNDGKYFIYGGEGQLLGDPGSGFHLGQTIVRSELRKMAFSEKPSSALEMIFQKLKINSPHEFVSRLSDVENPVQTIAGFVKLVGWELIDDQCIIEICHVWEQVIQKFNCKTIILSGGIFSSGKRIVHLLQKSLPDRDFFLLESEPAEMFASYDFTKNIQRMSLGKKIDA